VYHILKGCRIDNTDIDLANQFHHAFFFGDLNYRIDLGLTDGGSDGTDVDDGKSKKERPHVHFDEVMQLVNKKNW